MMFLNLGPGEIIIIPLLCLLIFFIFERIGNYGKDTALGYWGSILLAVTVSPVAAFLIILFIKGRRDSV